MAKKELAKKLILSKSFTSKKLLCRLKTPLILKKPGQMSSKSLILKSRLNVKKKTCQDFPKISLQVNKYLTGLYLKIKLSVRKENQNPLKPSLATFVSLNQVKMKTKMFTSKKLIGHKNPRMTKMRTQKKTGPALVTRLPPISRMKTLRNMILLRFKISQRI